MDIRTRIFHGLFALVEACNRWAARGRRDFFDSREFDWVPQIEAGWMDVREELDRVLGRVDALPNFQDIQAEQQNLTTDDRWKVFIFHAYGKVYQPNLDRCPKTAALLRAIPGMRSAMFSVLRGPKCIPPHRGPFNGVLRYHLALRVPGDPERCRIRVGDQWRSWTEGRSLIFDDTTEHEVVDDLRGERVVLFVDFMRPVAAPLSWLNAAMVVAFGRLSFIQNALANLDRWNVDFDTKPIRQPSAVSEQLRIMRELRQRRTPPPA
jgi:aspartyl/asparaginyl beta-hydroxylase (cupin superfamily)